MLKPANSTFIAIGVRQGDAFFLQRQGTTALIDGGRSRVGFAGRFRGATGLHAVDILVCTHNDADHALGVLGFLDALTCKEVWLPGSWTDRLEDLLVNQSEFFRELANNVGSADLSAEMRPPLLEALGEQYSNPESRQDGKVGLESLLDALGESFEKAEATPELFWPYSLPWPVIDLWFAPYLWESAQGDQRRFQLLLEVVSAASRIKEISLAAYHLGARIRWFEHHRSANNGGMEGFLLPVNAREIVSFPQRRWSALQYLALTVANRESLVFQSPLNAYEAPVLLTADSDLSFPQPIDWKDGMIITAPHHGSEANSGAYKRFDRDTRGGVRATWVRSDGRFKTRPGNSYLRVKGDRFCTLCRGSSSPRQDVRLSAASVQWQPVSTTIRCSCV